MILDLWESYYSRSVTRRPDTDHRRPSHWLLIRPFRQALSSRWYLPDLWTTPSSPIAQQVIEDEGMAYGRPARPAFYSPTNRTTGLHSSPASIKTKAIIVLVITSMYTTFLYRRGVFYLKFLACLWNLIRISIYSRDESSHMYRSHLKQQAEPALSSLHHDPTF